MRHGLVAKRARRTLGVVAAALFLTGSSLVGAASVQAATITITDVDCTLVGTRQGVPITASPNDVLVFSFNLATCDMGYVSRTLVAGSSAIEATLIGGGSVAITSVDYLPVWEVKGSPLAEFTSFRVTLGQWSGTADITLESGTGSTTWAVTVVGETSRSGPPSSLQQFGKPASGTCETVAPESLNWSGVASGSWGESWAQWMNDGLGGAVCTRTLVYSSSQSRWIVG